MLLRPLAALALLVACHATTTPPPVARARPVANAAPPQTTEIDSRDILARTTVAPKVSVKHVLFAWSELAPAYQGHLDPRAQKRTQAQAARLAEDIAAKLRANPASIDALARQYSEDPGSLSGDPYEVAADLPFVDEFKNLALRLEINELGIVRTHFGYHVILRIAPPLPDPLESADILARVAGSGPVDVKQILIGWAGLDATRDAIGKQRTKAEADALATEVLAKVRAGGDMPALMKQYSEDPGTADTGAAFTVDTTTPIIEPLRNVALRLALDEAGLVKTRFGWDIVKRVPPPPPDPLDSIAILNRTTIAPHTKVKHILLGWKDVHADDPRGKVRTRKQLEALVKATVKKLSRKGASFEAAMKELSEDPGSAETGESYDATPEAGLVKPFLNLSLRLQLDEIGVVKTEFGIHIIKRVE